MISNAAAADALRQVRALKQQVANLERRLALAGGGGGSDLEYADDPPADTSKLWIDTNASERELRMFDPGLALPASDPAAWVLVADPIASEVPFTPTGGISATNVQSAIAELDGEAIPKSIIDAKGDLLVGTAADTIARRAVGGNFRPLVPNSGEADGLEWAPHTYTYAVQTGIHGINGSATWLPGCVITLTEGVWIVVARFRCRAWFYGSGTVSFRHQLAAYPAYAVYSQIEESIAVTGGDRAEGGSVLVMPWEVPEGTTQQAGMVGTSTVIHGSNFAGGYRYDTGLYGGQCAIEAWRLF